jgi:hypothetical protein
MLKRNQDLTGDQRRSRGTAFIMIPKLSLVTVELQSGSLSVGRYRRPGSWFHEPDEIAHVGTTSQISFLKGNEISTADR